MTGEGQRTRVSVGVDCFLCGRVIDEAGPDPVRVTMEPREGWTGGPTWQTFWCHFACFQRSLHPEFIRRYGGIESKGDA